MNVIGKNNIAKSQILKLKQNDTSKKAITDESAKKREKAMKVF